MSRDTRYSEIGSRKRAISRYAMIKNRCTKPVGRSSSYSGIPFDIDKEEFVSWFMKNDFVGSSVDRIIPSLGYVKGNIRLVPMTVNLNLTTKVVEGELVCFRCGVSTKLELCVKDKRRSCGHTNVCLKCEKSRSQLKRRRLKSEPI